MDFGGESVKILVPRQHIARARPVYTVPFAATLTLDGLQSNKFKATLTGNCTINAVNWLDDNYILHLIQGGAGGFTVTWGTTPILFEWSLDTTPALSIVAGKRDVFSFTVDTASDGTRVAVGSFLKGYAK